MINHNKYPILLDMRRLNFPKFGQVSFSIRFFKKSGLVGTRLRILPTQVDQLFSYGDTVTLKMFIYGSCFRLYSPIFVLRAEPLSLYLHRTEDSTPSEQIKGHLSEESIQDVFDNPGKPGCEAHGCANLSELQYAYKK